MKLIKKATLHNISIFFSLLLLALPSCGGGTSGTGITETRIIDGTIVNSNGSAVIDAKITIKETGAETLSDEDGNFSLPLGLNEEDFTIEVETPNNSDSFTISSQTNIATSSDAQVSNVNINFEVSSDSINLLSISNSPTSPPNEGPVGDSDLVKEPCSPNGESCPADKFCDYIDLSCGKANNPNGAFGVCREFSQVCIALYAPVCGCDGKTYGNSCEAQGAGQSISKDGEC